MTITTALSIGDKAYSILDDEVREVTIGEVRATAYRDLRGLIQTEQYMAYETGLGTGILYELGRDLFRTRVEAGAALEELA